MKKKLWVNLFLRVAAIFAVFVAVLAAANSTLLVKYFTFKERRLLVEKSAAVAAIDVTDTETMSDELTRLSDKYGFDAEVYREDGQILYTTFGPQMMDYVLSGWNQKGFLMNHEELTTVKRTVLSDGTVLETASERFTGNEYLLCKRYTDGVVTELRIQTDILENSALIASEFVSIIAVVCFAASIVWILVFARKFSAPIAEMSEITGKMAGLDFSRKVKVKSNDEIGQLANSINNLSDKLDESLQELRESNAKLRDEIELERQLDVMRRGFVANVSHELKTPLSIISGYAEGLKLNINSESKETYCDTIIDETERMNRLVLSILQLSKYESGQIPTNNENFDISVIASDMLTRIFKGRDKIGTDNEIPENTLVYCDPVQTEQIFKSYLENAASHTPDGGEVKISAEDCGEEIRIRVYNTGENIDPEIMPHIWESFWRANQSHNRDENRFGLGLSIVSAIVKMQGSSCGVYNTDGGVCFWFTCKKAK